MRTNTKEWRRNYARLRRMTHPDEWRRDYEKHKASRLASAARYKRLHPERDSELALIKKLKVFALFGSKCARCGFEDHRALQLDHIKGCPLSSNGRAKEAAKEKGSPLYRAILRGEKDISQYQLLCANCNTIKAFENKERGNYKKMRAITEDCQKGQSELFPK